MLNYIIISCGTNFFQSIPVKRILYVQSEKNNCGRF